MDNGNAGKLIKSNAETGPVTLNGGSSGRAAPGAGMTRRDFLRAGLCGAVCLGLGAGIQHGLSRTAFAVSPQKGFVNPRPSEWFVPQSGAKIKCTLCPLECRMAAGERGACRVRENRGGQAYSLAWGNPVLVQADPVERKPFFHVLPGSMALSVSTAGCPLACRFCEVWDMALVSPEDVHAYDLPPEEVVALARSVGARSISYAFGEPVVFYEYMRDIAGLAREQGLLNLVHTSGYISMEPLEALAGLIDAANVDLKGFDAAFYRRMTGGDLAVVKRSLRILKARGVHIEITNLVIPGVNDDPAETRAMCEWIRNELGPGVPVHFARFYPLYKLANLPPTPVATLDAARETAMKAGLEHVYVARVTGHTGENTFCPQCGGKIIDRMGFMIEAVRMENGACAHCGAGISGIWA